MTLTGPFSTNLSGLKSGLEMLEIDCHLTRDGQVVVHHDETLDRTAGQAIAIAETNYLVNKCHW